MLLQVAGSYVYFIARLSAIRQEMREQLKHRPDEELSLLILTPEEFQKARVEDHEIKVNGKMYDIARLVMKNNKVHVYALHDEAEDNLLAFLNEMVKRSSKDKKPVPSSLVGFIVIPGVTHEDILPAAESVCENPNTVYQFLLSDVTDQIISPPPRTFTA